MTGQADKNLNKFCHKFLRFRSCSSRVSSRLKSGTGPNCRRRRRREISAGTHVANWPRFSFINFVQLQQRAAAECRLHLSPRGAQFLTNKHAFISPHLSPPHHAAAIFLLPSPVENRPELHRAKRVLVYYRIMACESTAAAMVVRPDGPEVQASHALDRYLEQQLCARSKSNRLRSHRNKVVTSRVKHLKEAIFLLRKRRVSPDVTYTSAVALQYSNELGIACASTAAAFDDADVQSDALEDGEQDDSPGNSKLRSKSARNSRTANLLGSRDKVLAATIALMKEMKLELRLLQQIRGAATHFLQVVRNAPVSTSSAGAETDSRTPRDCVNTYASPSAGQPRTLEHHAQPSEVPVSSTQAEDKTPSQLVVMQGKLAPSPTPRTPSPNRRELDATGSSAETRNTAGSAPARAQLQVENVIPTSVVSTIANPIYSPRPLPLLSKNTIPFTFPAAHVPGCSYSLTPSSTVCPSTCICTCTSSGGARVSTPIPGSRSCYPSIINSKTAPEWLFGSPAEKQHTTLLQCRSGYDTSGSPLNLSHPDNHQSFTKPLLSGLQTRPMTSAWQPVPGQDLDRCLSATPSLFVDHESVHVGRVLHHVSPQNSNLTAAAAALPLASTSSGAYANSPAALDLRGAYALGTGCNVSPSYSPTNFLLSDLLTMCLAAPQTAKNASRAMAIGAPAAASFPSTSASPPPPLLQSNSVAVFADDFARAHAAPFVLPRPAMPFFAAAESIKLHANTKPSTAPMNSDMMLLQLALSSANAGA